MDFKISDPNYNAKTKITHNSITFFYPGSDSLNSCPYVLTVSKGSYFFECWGAWGYNNGRPGYTSGELEINETTTFYLYVGASFPSLYIAGISYNGGGSGDMGGGGSSDIRYLNGGWDNFHSFKSRIMVAAGGGGFDYDGIGGYGGGLNGTDGMGSSNNGRGGTQKQGGSGYRNGGFGFGGSSFRTDENGTKLDNGGGGGSGYYGGGTGMSVGCCSGGGGSSYISGYPGCDAIDESSKMGNIIHTGQSIHFSGIVFTNSVMIGGNESKPLPDGSTGFGTYSSGSIRVTSQFGTVVKQKSNCFPFSILNQFFIFINLVFLRT